MHTFAPGGGERFRHRTWLLKHLGDSGNFCFWATGKTYPSNLIAGDPGLHG